MADQASRNIGREVVDKRNQKVWRIKRADRFQVLLEDGQGLQDFVSYTAFHRWIRYTDDNCVAGQDDRAEWDRVINASVRSGFRKANSKNTPGGKP